MGPTINPRKQHLVFIHSFIHSLSVALIHSWPHNEIVGYVFLSSFLFYLSIVLGRRFMFMNVNAFFKSFLLALCGIDLLPRWTLS